MIDRLWRSEKYNILQSFHAAQICVKLHITLISKKSYRISWFYYNVCVCRQQPTEMTNAVFLVLMHTVQKSSGTIISLSEWKLITVAAGGIVRFGTLVCNLDCNDGVGR